MLGKQRETELFSFLGYKMVYCSKVYTQKCVILHTHFLRLPQEVSYCPLVHFYHIDKDISSRGVMWTTYVQNFMFHCVTHAVL